MRNHNVVRLVRYLCLAGAVFVVGCGPKQLPRKETYPIQGTLKFQGKPAAFVIIRLEPVAGSTGVSAEGTTDAEGSFELRTYSNEGMDGAASGEYAVSLEEYDPVRSGTIPKGSKPTPIPNGEMATDVRVEVRADSKTIEIEVP